MVEQIDADFEAVFGEYRWEATTDVWVCSCAVKGTFPQFACGDVVGILDKASVVRLDGDQYSTWSQDATDLVDCYLGAEPEESELAEDEVEGFGLERQVGCIAADALECCFLFRGFGKYVSGAIGGDDVSVGTADEFGSDRVPATAEVKGALTMGDLDAAEEARACGLKPFGLTGKQFGRG